MVANGPEIPIPANPNSPTTEETAAIQAALKAYYRVGDQVNYTASTINGLNPTPASYSFALSADLTDNTKTFVYVSAAQEDATDADGDSPSAAAETLTTLADTGINAIFFVAASIALVVISLVLLKKRRA